MKENAKGIYNLFKAYALMYVNWSYLAGSCETKAVFSLFDIGMYGSTDITLSKQVISTPIFGVSDGDDADSSNIHMRQHPQVMNMIWWIK